MKNEFGLPVPLNDSAKEQRNNLSARLKSAMPNTGRMFFAATVISAAGLISHDTSHHSPPPSLEPSREKLLNEPVHIFSGFVPQEFLPKTLKEFPAVDDEDDGVEAEYESLPTAPVKPRTDYFRDLLVKSLPASKPSSISAQEAVTFPSVTLPGVKLSEPTIVVAGTNERRLLLSGNNGGLPSETISDANKVFSFPINDQYEITSTTAQALEILPSDRWPLPLDSVTDVNMLPLSADTLLVSALLKNYAEDPGREDCSGQKLQWFLTKVDVLNRQKPIVLFTSNPDNGCQDEVIDKPSIAVGDNGGFVAVADITNIKGSSQLLVYKSGTLPIKVEKYNDQPVLSSPELKTRRHFSAVNYIGNDRYVVFSRGYTANSEILGKEALFYRIFDAKTGTSSEEVQIVSDDGQNPIGNIAERVRFISDMKFQYQSIHGTPQGGGTKDYSVAVLTFVRKKVDYVNDITKETELETTLVTVDSTSGRTIVANLPEPLLNPSVQVLDEEGSQKIYIVGTGNYFEQDTANGTIGNFEATAMEIDPQTGKVVTTHKFQKYSAPITVRDPNTQKPSGALKTDYALYKLLKVNGELRLITYQNTPINDDKDEAVLYNPSKGIPRVFALSH